MSSTQRTPFGWRVELRIRLIKKGIKLKNVAWNLTQDEARDLVTADCRYCGIQQPDPIPGNIDRIDASLPYVLDNCVPCCGWCIQMKQQRSEQEFLAQCQNIVDRLGHRLDIV